MQHVQAFTLRSQLAVMGRVIIAVIIREVKTRIGRNRIGLLWIVMEPILFTLGVVLVRMFLSRNSPFGESAALFMVSGLLVVRAFTSTAGQLSNAISANKALLTYPPVKPIDLILGRAALEMVITLFVWAVFFTLANVFIENKVLYHPERAFAAFFLLMWFAFCVGYFNAVVSNIFLMWSKVWTIIRLPLLLCSGVFYVPILMPPVMQDILVWNPVLHCVEMLRTGIYLTYEPLLSVNYVIWLGAILLLLAMALERTYRHILLNR
ncbi:ABC transporter permease [Pseudaminobacter sp. 19-2017]|uniref:Transport permease protein n=1 Tax=Pseudaminobacter soli (ex Zhang et al. 2022) TaxID=2831468 RepID=A0A942I2A3_9HYPH|nr:ABC transporter permease [Pseudaminobacter soli]MBS3648079.1 ABC transporter permease [Pseudaminobacter soli]